MQILIAYHQFSKKDSMANANTKDRKHITLDMYHDAQNILPWSWYIILLETMNVNY
jgi:hypothetical protein